MKDFNYVGLNADRVREIIKEMLDVETKNVAVCTNFKNSITIFNDRLKATSVEPLYCLVPNDYKRDDSDTSWLYDISKFKIYEITSSYLENKGYDVNNLLDNRTRLPIDRNLLVYTSSGSIPKIKDKFTLKEKACLYLKYPNSGTEWLDDLIRKSINTI